MVFKVERPRALITRTALAVFILSMIKLFSRMSQRCAVNVQGIPETRLAIIAIVAVVAAHCAWMWSACSRVAMRASKRDFGNATTFLKKIERFLLQKRTPAALATRRGALAATNRATPRISRE